MSYNVCAPDSTSSLTQFIFSHPATAWRTRGDERTTEKIIGLMRENPHITIKELTSTYDITEDGIYRNTMRLRKTNIIRRVGGKFGGHWEVLI